MQRYTVKERKFPNPPVITWAIYRPNERYANFDVYATLGHAKSALRGFGWPNPNRYNVGMELLEWSDGQWVQTDIEEIFSHAKR